MDTSEIYSRRLNAKERYAETKKSAVLLESGLDEKWWADSTKCYCYLRNVQDLLADGTVFFMKGDSGNHSKVQ